MRKKLIDGVKCSVDEKGESTFHLPEDMTTGQLNKWRARNLKTINEFKNN